MPTNPDKSAEYYARHYNRYIKQGARLYCLSPLNGPASEVTAFRSRKGVLFGKSERTGTWLPTTPDMVKQHARDGINLR